MYASSEKLAEFPDVSLHLFFFFEFIAVEYAAFYKITLESWKDMNVAMFHSLPGCIPLVDSVVEAVRVKMTLQLFRYEPDRAEKA